MYNISKKEKESLFNIIKRLPGYNTHMIDKNGNDLLIGDRVKLFLCNDEDYLIGIVTYDSKIDEFYIELDGGCMRYSYNWYNTRCLYFKKLNINGTYDPYIDRQRIEKDENYKIKNELDKEYYYNLINNEKYEELYNNIQKFINQNIFKLTLTESALFNKILKNKKFTFNNNMILNLRTFKELNNQNIFNFIAKNLKTIKDRIEFDIDTNYKFTKKYYEGELIINEIVINWSYNILENRCSILNIELMDIEL